MTPSVVVIGGGPAGLAAALAFGQRGVSTLVCERGDFPVDKACGEGLLANAVARLAHFGVGAAELARSGRPLAGVRYTSASGRQAEAPALPGSAFGMRRTALSELLVSRVRAQGCVEVLAGVSAELRAAPGSPPEVWLGRDRLTPRLVVGADGLSSRVRRKIGLGTRFVGPRRYGVRRHFELESWTDHVEVSFAAGVEAYVTPLRDGVNVAILWEAEALRGASAPFTELLPRLPALAQRLARARSHGRDRASGPFHQDVEARSVGGVLLVGDASGYVDALTGEGVGLALAQAEVLGRVLAPELLANADGGALSARELEPARRALAAVCRANRRFTRLLLGLSRREPWFELAVALLGRDPELFQHFVAASGGERAPLRLPLASALRLPRTLFDVLRGDFATTAAHALRNSTG